MPLPSKEITIEITTYRDADCIICTRNKYKYDWEHMDMCLFKKAGYKKFFYDDGNVYVIKTDLIKKGDRYCKKIGKKIISRWENVEIDDKFNFWVAENILKQEKINHRKDVNSYIFGLF